VKLPDISTHDGRRAWAFLAIMGGAMVFTAIIIWLICLLKGNADYLANIAYLANGQVFIGMSALGWAMGRRLLASASKDGITIDDKGHSE
jgi:hypothetical protein